MVRTALLSALAGAVIAADWLRLEHPSAAAGRASLLIALAVVPALVRPLWARVIALAVVALVGAAVAFSLPVHALWSDTGEFFSRLGSRFAGGVSDFYAFRLPIDPAVHPRMHMLLLFATFAFTVVVSLAVAGRRAIAALACFLIAAGWPSTLLAGGHDLGRGAFILVTALVLLAGLTERGRALALPGVAVVVLAALALSTSAAVAKPAFLQWQRWNPYSHHAKPVSVSFVWNATYTGIRFPKKRTTVLTIVAPPNIGTYWRATVLDDFADNRWLEHLWRETDLQSHDVYTAASRDPANAIEQQVTIDAFRDPHLVGASVPVAYNISEPADYLGQNVVVAVGGVHPGQRYLVWSYAPHPTPRQLLRSRPVYPHALTEAGHDLELGPSLDAPAFGVPARDEALRRRLVGPLAPYRALLSRARGIVGRTGSPYAATVALEQWFRATGGFTYSTQPPQAPGLPPLVGFVTKTKTGYCQHFAGAMALMLRLLGIPARVAAGFVSGHFANGAWTVTDHDAHTWVEVWFRGYGWLPFDPTPGRGHLASSYSAASTSFNLAAEAKLLARVVRGGSVFGADAKAVSTRAEKNGRLPHSAADVGVRGLNPNAGAHHRHSLGLFLFLLALGVTAVLALLKLARRRLRYLTRDPRRVATACARDLADFLVDQRIVVRGATARELAAEIEEHFAVSGTAFATAVEAARFGRPADARAAADPARRELGALKRQLRRQLFVLDRARGFVSLRSLGFS
jgi:transglutaminase-like putative cysteine protease